MIFALFNIRRFTSSGVFTHSKLVTSTARDFSQAASRGLRRAFKVKEQRTAPTTIPKKPKTESIGPKIWQNK